MGIASSVCLYKPAFPWEAAHQVPRASCSIFCSFSSRRLSPGREHELVPIFTEQETFILHKLPGLDPGSFDFQRLSSRRWDVCLTREELGAPSCTPSQFSGSWESSGALFSPHRARVSGISAAGGGEHCGGELAPCSMLTWLLLHPFPFVPRRIRGLFWFSAPAPARRPLLFLGGAESCRGIYRQEERQACAVGQSWHCAVRSNRGFSKASCTKHPRGSACSKTPG